MQPMLFAPTIVARLFSLRSAAKTSGPEPPRSFRMITIGSW